MESMYFLIPVSLLILVGATGVLIWSVYSGQYDDMEREGERILQDDDLPLAAEQQPSDSADDDTEKQPVEGAERGD